MKKRVLSILLAFSMVISCSVTAYGGEIAGDGDGQAQEENAAVSDAENEQPKSVEDDEELMNYIKSLGDYTEESANAYTPTELKNLMEEGSSDRESVIDKIENEDTDKDGSVTEAEYVKGEVLFSKKEGSVSLFSGSIDSELKSIGVSSPEEVVSFDGKDTEKSGLASLFSGSEKTVWYKAKVSGDVNDAVEKLKDIDGIENAEPNYIYKSDSYGKPTEVETGDSWAFNKLMKNSGSDDLWWDKVLGQDKAPGEGVVVAVIDTGVDYNHEDLKANMWVNMAELNGKPGVDDDGDGYIDDIYGVNTTAMGEQAGDPMDDNGHGTHVAGIIGMSANGTGGVGLAWGTKIMAIKAGQSTGSFASSDIAKAIDYAHMMGADVINMSFGGTGKSYLIEQALASAFSDCVLVASAGNNGAPTADAPADFIYKENVYPAGYSYVLGVMATDQYGNLAEFSNWDYYKNSGAEYELTAPGVNVYSTLPNNRYAKWSGTSMAAPCVAAAAAIVRSQFKDKDTFSSRFIMGQLASATEDTTTYVDKINEMHTYGALNILNSCQNMPKPNLSVKEVFALDNVTESNEVNDGDRIIDAGETIDLGLTIRNQWGQTGEITIKADAVSDGGVANPYVTFEKDTITIDPAGTFGESNNGYVWDDSLLTDIKNPIRFKIAANAPNDAEIKINLTVTTTNGYGDDDTTIYTILPKPTFTFRVQNGRAIRGTLTEDTTLSSDYYWIVEDKLFIPEGITLTVEPGTNIQFWSSDYEDAYGQKTIAGIVNSGTLNMIGTEDKPIEMFPGDKFERYVVEIAGDGWETIKYCNIINPGLGVTDGGMAELDNINHCVLIQNYDEYYTRYISNGNVCDGEGHNNFYVSELLNSKCIGFRNFSGYRETEVRRCENTIFNDCIINFGWINITSIKNSVIMRGNGGNYNVKIGNTVLPYNSNILNCAILNPVLNTDPSTWSTVTAGSYNKDIEYYNLSNNYWGTENKTLINKMIVDADDYPGTLGDIVEDPILTLDSESLSDIYPFSTAVWVEDKGGNIVSTVSPGETYKVHVTYNRNMDQTVQPTVTYGPDTPYTDYSVRGSWKSAREWVGETYISPVMTSGTQYFKTTGGRAADDHWLVCGNDILRFSFNVSDTGALAMMLNASGGANKVDLSWAQNDYDTLAGYNLYRSTSADGGFEKINSSVLTGTSYTDTDVEPGIKYYYYFKVVNTDGNEEESQSNVASAAPIDNIAPSLTHSPIKTSKANASITVSATATDNIAVTGVTLYYRTKGEASYKSVKMVAGDNDRYVATIPAVAVTAAGVQYYVEARDGDGNVANSGTAQLPNEITVDSKPYINGVTPVTTDTAGGAAITILGGNFTSDMTLTVGGEKIEKYTLVDNGQITFAAPAKAMGSYEIILAAKDGSQVKAPVMLSYTDKGSSVQISTDIELTAGKECIIPVYVNASGELTSFHIEMDLPYENFSSVTAELADGVNGGSFTTNYDYSSGTLKMGCASSADMKPADGKALINVKVIPSAVTADKTVAVKLHDVQLNGAPVDNVISGRAVIHPNFSLNAIVNYFKTGLSVPGVSIKAGGIEALTDADGRAALTGITKSEVDVIASKDEYVHSMSAIGANDAVLVLQSAVDLITLDDSQKLAGDVDGNGVVDEVDAARILKYAVGLDKTFPAGSWKFIPEHQSATLGSYTPDMYFTAVLTGDVDGSWKAE